MIKTFVRGLLFGLLIGYAPSVKADVQTPITTISSSQAANCVIEFDQDADSLPAAQAFRYEATVDTATSLTIPVTCSGSASPFICTTPLPNKAIGTHSVTIIASETLSDGTVLASAPSLSITYRIANAPNPPKNLHIKKN